MVFVLVSFVFRVFRAGNPVYCAQAERVSLTMGINMKTAMFTTQDGASGFVPETHDDIFEYREYAEKIARENYLRGTSDSSFSSSDYYQVCIILFGSIPQTIVFEFEFEPVTVNCQTY